jgi:HK97 family phage major capsid protein
MKFKQFLVSKGITEDAFKEMEATKQAELHGEFMQSLVDKAVSKEDFDALKTQIENLPKGIDQTAIDALKTQLDDLALTVTENKGASANENPFKELEDGLVEKQEAIKNQKSAGTIANFTIKAVGPVLTTNVTSAAGGNVVAMTQSTGELYATNDNRLFAEGLMSSMSTDADQITYIDEVAGEGDAGMTAEGNTKSQSDVDYVERTLVLQNVTHFIKVSTKMLKQPNYIVQAVKNNLLRKLQLKKQSQLLSGNNTAPNIKGIKEWATAFAAGTFADTVATPNLNDLIRVIVAQIQLVADDFYPNYVIMSHDRFAGMDLKKADDGHYVLPPFSTLDNRIVAGVRVLSSNEFTIDEMLVGDFTKANYVYRDSIQVSINLDGNDYTKNLRTILAEQEIGLYVSNNEVGAFVLVDDIDQALTDIAIPVV